MWAPRYTPRTTWGHIIMSTAAWVGVSKCEHALSIHGFCTRTPASGHNGCWRHVKVTRQAFCGRLYTCTIIVSVTDIIFVVRCSFKDIKYDIVMYTKNAAQTTMDTKARKSRSRSKDGGQSQETAISARYHETSHLPVAAKMWQSFVAVPRH